MSRFEVIRGVEGCCLTLDDTRIAGPKPWGGGTVIHAWETGNEYKAVDTRSRWHQLFGTPEKAARTLRNVCQFTHGGELCDRCQCYLFGECNRELRLRSERSIYDALLGWLRVEGDAR